MQKAATSLRGAIETLDKGYLREFRLLIFDDALVSDMNIIFTVILISIKKSCL